MPVFRIWQGSEYSRVTQGSKYATIWWNMSEYDVNVIMSEFSITDRVPNMYPTKNRAKVTLRVNEDLLRDKWAYSQHCQESKMECFGKIIIVFTNFCTKDSILNL